MAYQEVTTYDPKTCPLHELTHLEDVFERGYIVDNEDYKIEHISVKSYPAMLFHALKCIKKDYKGHYNSISHIQRLATLYGASLLDVDKTINKIIDDDLDISNIEDEEILNKANSISRIGFMTSSCTYPKTISMFAWTKNWITSNCDALGLNYTQLGIYALILGLSKYDIKNKVVKNAIDKEVNHFDVYLKERYTKTSNIKYRYG